jgi:hypothetical protein
LFFFALGNGAEVDWIYGWITLTVLPQVTAPWRFSIGAGAARVDAARARMAKTEVYMLLDVGMKANVVGEASWNERQVWLAMVYLLLAERNKKNNAVPILSLYTRVFC